MLGGADNPNGELPSYITGADTCSLYTQSLALKHTYEVYFGYDRTLRKYGRFRQKLPVKTDIRKNSARRRPVTGRSPRTGEEAQYICSYSEQVRPEAFIIGMCTLFFWNDLSTYPEARSSKQIHE